MLQVVRVCIKNRQVLPILVLGAILSACSSGPAAPKPGTAAFSWAVARDGYRTGDLLKTDATLLQLSKGSSEFAAPARILHLVVSAGLTHGYSELADVYEAGAQAQGPGALRLRRESAELRSLAANTAIEFAEALQETVQSEHEAQVPFAFEFPVGSAEQPPSLARVAGGAWFSDVDRETLLYAMLQRGVVLAAASAAGYPDDAARAKALFPASNTQIPRPTFVYGMAKLLYREADLFGDQRMSRPNRMFMLWHEVRLALRSVPQTPEVRELAAEIESKLKALSGV